MNCGQNVVIFKRQFQVLPLGEHLSENIWAAFCDFYRRQAAGDIVSQEAKYLHRYEPVWTIQTFLHTVHDELMTLLEVDHIFNLQDFFSAFFIQYLWTINVKIFLKYWVWWLEKLPQRKDLDQTPQPVVVRTLCLVFCFAILLSSVTCVFIWSLSVSICDFSFFKLGPASRFI